VGLIVGICFDLEAYLMTYLNVLSHWPVRLEKLKEITGMSVSTLIR
jgi:hypothetical protein